MTSSIFRPWTTASPPASSSTCWANCGHSSCPAASSSAFRPRCFIGSFVNALKIVIRGFLHFLGIRRQQFWGWRRTRDEYRELLRKADFRHLEDGWLEDGFETYWIRGC